MASSGSGVAPGDAGTSGGLWTTPDIEIRPGCLDSALRALSVRASVGILFAPGMAAGHASPGLSGTISLDEALQRLLEGSGLSYHRTVADAVVIYALPQEHESPATPAIPEILVLGRKTQNADIRRTENDIQPYQALTSDEIVSSHDDDVGQLLSRHLTNDGEGLAPSQDPVGNGGSNRSEINLQGLGANQTLVLVDGARMPGVPSQFTDLTLKQPDLNGIPLFAIDRVESLTLMVR